MKLEIFNSTILSVHKRYTFLGRKIYLNANKYALILEAHFLFLVLQAIQSGT